MDELDRLLKIQTDFINSKISDIEPYYVLEPRTPTEITNKITNFDEKILPLINTLFEKLESSEANKSEFKSSSKNSRQCCIVYRDSYASLLKYVSVLENRNLKLKNSIEAISRMLNHNVHEFEQEKEKIRPLQKENTKKQITIQTYRQNEEIYRRTLLQKFEIPFYLSELSSTITNVNENLQIRNKTELNEFQNRLNVLSSENQSLKEELEQKKNENQKLEEEKDEFLNQFTDSQIQISTLNDQIQQLNDQIKQLQNQNAEKDKKIQELDKTNEKLNSNITVLREDKASFDQKLKEAQESFDQQLQEALDKQTKFKEASVHWLKKNKDTAAQLNEALEKLAALEKDKEEGDQSGLLKEELEHALERISQLEKEKEEMDINHQKEIELLSQLNADDNELPPSTLPELNEPEIGEARDISDDDQHENQETAVEEEQNETKNETDQPEIENEEKNESVQPNEEENEEKNESVQPNEEENEEQAKEEPDEADEKQTNEVQNEENAHDTQNEDTEQNHEEEVNEQVDEHENDVNQENQEDEEMDL